MTGKLLASAGIGGLLGFLASRLLFLQWLTLIPWGLAALLIGYFCKTGKESLLAGLVYGFFLGFVFMAAAYTGKDPILSRFAFFALMGLISAVFGTVLSAAGFLFNTRVVNKAL